MTELPVNTIVCGDCLEVMRGWPAGKIDCCVTSPPYWGLRDYGVEGQLGLEKTPEEYVAKMVEIFREVWRVLKPEGTLWLNLGDSYVGSGKGGGGCFGEIHKSFRRDSEIMPRQNNGVAGLKPKDLCLIPHRVAMALQADGWWVRDTIIWHKPNPMPESCTDRCTKAHEYIFLLAKSGKPIFWTNNKLAISTDKQPKGTQGIEDEDWEWVEHKTEGRVKSSLWSGHDYYYDNEAIKEPYCENSDMEYRKTLRLGKFYRASNENPYKENTPLAGDRKATPLANGRNKRSVWTVTTKPYSEAHFATFPPDLIKPCILAGCPKEVCKKCGKARVRVRIIDKGELVPDNPNYKPRGNNRGDSFVKNAMTPAGETQGHPNFHYDSKTTGWTDCGCGEKFEPGVVFDPFMGSGTVAEVAAKSGRNYVGCELNPEYIKLGRVEAVETGVPVKEARTGQMGLFK